MTTGKMAEKPEHRLLATHTAYAGWAKFLIATIRLADGHTVEREIEDHGEAVCILPYNPVRRTAILVRQLRAPVLFAAGAQETLEAIAGVIENEDAAACVRREAMEEALLDLDAVEHIFTAWTMPESPASACISIWAAMQVMRGTNCAAALPANTKTRPRSNSASPTLHAWPTPMSLPT
jgi:hypothetical protein